MINLVDSLVESYLYSDMYNREYEGGNDGRIEKIYGAGIPVEYIVPSLQKEYSVHSDNQVQEGGQNCKGPFSNKVVPVGLVFIRVQRDPDLEYEDHFYPGENREVVPDSLYELLVGSVLKSNNRDNNSDRKKTRTTFRKKQSKDRSRKKS